jgi:hypothetical protein
MRPPGNEMTKKSIIYTDGKYTIEMNYCNKLK